MRAAEIQVCAAKMLISCHDFQLTTHHLAFDRRKGDGWCGSEKFFHNSPDHSVIRSSVSRCEL